MATPLDDLPHPVPPVASLRWKENWLFIVMAPEQKSYGVIHVNTEPAFNRARFTCNFEIDGSLHSHSGETAFPADYAGATTIGDGCVTVRFVEPGKRFEVDIDTEDLSAELRFEATFDTFDFAACRAAAPENPSFKEAMTLGTGLPHDHHQQALSVQGTLRGGRSGETRPIDGLGYRDHSYCMRGDSLIARHSWCALFLPGRVIGVKTAEMLDQPGVVAREAYVDDDGGARVVREISVEPTGTGPDGLGERVQFTLADLHGQTYRIEADVSGRLATVPLMSEKPGSSGHYRIVESLCPIRDLDSGETGLGHIELGAHSAAQASNPR